jgi:glycine/D-amino acid oxidase-like deaminating enzyme
VTIIRVWYGAMAESVWAHTLPAADRFEGLPLAADTSADVVVVGGGYTGLWTAYYLALLDATLRVVVVEAETVGFGASGRNGGWCSGLLPMSLRALSDLHGRHAATAMQRAMYETVEEIERVLRVEGIDAGSATGGTLTLARSPDQQRRLRGELAELLRCGFTERDARWLERAEAVERCAATGVLGAVSSPHGAALHPLRLAHGIARAAQRRGVTIHERTPATGIHPERVETAGGTIGAQVVVLATEAYTSQLPGRTRELLPIYSMMVATEPLDAERWQQIGLADRATFTDGRHLLVYGQRTADGRLAFGGRGAPYHFGSRIAAGFDTDERVRGRLVSAARELFPVLGDVEFPYHWGGPLGVARDWHCAVHFDRTSRLAFAGGYAGDGVATSNLAGRTLAELVTGQESELCELAWVGHHSPAWEHEPWRWLGVNAARMAAGRADRAERSGGPLAARRAAGWRRVLATLGGR